MTSASFRYASEFDLSVEELFQWHQRPGAFERLNPPWQPVKVIDKSGDIKDGSKIHLRVPFGPFGIHWKLEHQNFEQNKKFEDFQTSGPFKKWHHIHLFEKTENNKSKLTDKIDFRVPFGQIGEMLIEPVIKKQLHSLFRFRHQRTKNDLNFSEKSKGRKTMKIALSGSTGFIGSNLIPLLQTGGHHVLRLVRDTKDNTEDTILWDPYQSEIKNSFPDGIDAVIHLSGENIGSGIWTEKKKKKIRDSRVISTRFIAEHLAQMKNPPATLLIASGINYYGNQGDKKLTENDQSGNDFLAEVVEQWEAAADTARSAGIRVVHLRFGAILHPAQGMLQKLVPVFKLGGGAVMGDGSQYMPWISIDDVLGVVHHILHNKEINGPVNVVSPNPVTNTEFTKILARVLNRPSFLKIPRFLLSNVGGEMVRELLLSSNRAVPQKLISSDYNFIHPDLETALRFLLGKN